MNVDIEILRYLAKKDKEIEKLFNKLIYQLSKVSLNITKIREGAFFSFDDYPELKSKVDEVLNTYTQEQQEIILSGIDNAMRKSFKANDERFGERSKYSEQAITDMRESARNAFVESRMKPEEGLSLSQKVWNYTRQAKAEFEAGMSEVLEEGLASGTSAEELGRKLRNKLKHPDMVYRRYHLKKMTAKGIKDVIEWRRKVVDSDGKVRYVKEDLEKVGRGVYRSSRKNALRLAATEINMAYRYADHVRWNNEPFVIGFRIRLSENHTLNGKPFHDMCDELVGVYPKTFKWSGWHPRCRCIATSILANEDEMEKISELSENEYRNYRSPNLVKKMPKAYDEYVKKEKTRILASMDRGTTPYWVKDNYKGGDIRKKFVWEREKRVKTQAERDAIQKAWDKRRHERLIEEARIKRHANRDALAIQEAWDFRKEKNRIDGILERTWGFKKSKPMDFFEANYLRGNVNYQPQYILVDGKYRKNPMYDSTNHPYHVNCQTCVVANELRRRGWNVTATGNLKGSINEKLSVHTELAWMQKDGSTPISFFLEAKRRDKVIPKISELIKEGERYHIKWTWNNARSGHIITVEKDAKGLLRFYDPQTGSILEGLGHYLNEIQLKSIRLLRVDDLLPRPIMVERIVQRLNNRNKVAGVAAKGGMEGVRLTPELIDARRKALNSGSFVLSEDLDSFSNLHTSNLLRKKKSLERLLNHTISEEEIDALKFIWNNPNELKHLRVSPLGEGKDLTSPKDIKNIKKKRNRGVVAYHLYEFKYNNVVYYLKLEEHRLGFEQMYSLTKMR